MRSFKSRLVMSVMALMALSLLACSKNEQSNDTANAEQAGAEQASAANPAVTHGAVEPKIERSQAEQMVLEKYPDGHLISAELEWNEGKLLHAIEVKTARLVYEVSIDAVAGQVIDTDDKTAKFQADSTKGTAPMFKVDLAARDAAEKVALDFYPGKVQKWKAATDSGRAVFSFKIKSDAGMKKIMVSKETNKILSRR